MKVLIAAGGTGGHVNPALAVARELKNRDSQTEICFVGTSDRIEANIVPAAGYPLKTIDINGLKRGRSFDDIKSNIKTAIKLVKSTSEVKKIIKEYNPDVVLGFGGYVTAPVLRVAAKMGIPTAIHEQNAFPGLANKSLSELVDVVMLTAEEAKQHMKFKNEPVVTGLPVRGELLEADPIISRQELGFDERPVILCMGGSLGSREINKAMIDVIAADMYDKKYNYIVSTGQNGLWVPEKLADKGVDISKYDNLKIRPYIDDMARCLSAADLVICRAGASSLSEIQALGKPSILIPSPNVTENHQYHNAMALVRKNAAVIIEEKDLDGVVLKRKVDSILKDKRRLESVGAKAREMAHVDATEKICDIVYDIARK